METRYPPNRHADQKAGVQVVGSNAVTISYHTRPAGRPRANDNGRMSGWYWRLTDDVTPFGPFRTSGRALENAIYELPEEPA